MLTTTVRYKPLHEWSNHVVQQNCSSTKHLATLQPIVECYKNQCHRCLWVSKELYIITSRLHPSVSSLSPFPTSKPMLFSAICGKAPDNDLLYTSSQLLLFQLYLTESNSVHQYFETHFSDLYQSKLLHKSHCTELTTVDGVCSKAVAPTSLLHSLNATVLYLF